MVEISKHFVFIYKQYEHYGSIFCVPENKMQGRVFVCKKETVRWMRKELYSEELNKFYISSDALLLVSLS
jgi:hypothetical protein